MAPFAVADSHPQYAMSLMDTEALLDTLDGSCEFPRFEGADAGRHRLGRK